MQQQSSLPYFCKTDRISLHLQNNSLSLECIIESRSRHVSNETTRPFLQPNVATSNCTPKFVGECPPFLHRVTAPQFFEGRTALSAMLQQTCTPDNCFLFRMFSRGWQLDKISGNVISCCYFLFHTGKKVLEIFLQGFPTCQCLASHCEFALGWWGMQKWQAMVSSECFFVTS